MRQYIDTVQDSAGNALNNASIQVLNYNTGAAATIYSDNGVTLIASATVTSDATGQFMFYAPDGYYTLKFSYKGNLYKTQSPVSIFDGAVEALIVDTGAVNAYAATQKPFPLAYAAGLRVRVKIATTNTGASTLNINSLGTKPIVLNNGGALSGGELQSGDIVTLDFDGTSWLLDSPAVPANLIRTPAEIAAGVVPTKYQQYELYMSRYSTTDNTALTQALAVAAQYTQARLVVDRSLTISQNYTFPSNITLEFQGTGAINLGTQTLTMSCELPPRLRKCFDISGTGALITGPIKAPHLHYEMFGVVADGTTDVAALCVKVNKIAVDASMLDIRCRPATYKCNSTVQTAGDTTGSIYHPSIIGADMDKTIFDFSSLASGLPGFLVQSPTSGHVINKDVLQLLRVQGNANSLGVEFRGVCGARASRVSFYTHAEAVRFNNEAASTFTEFCEASNCYFSTDVVLVARYKKNAGDSSFHGSGITGGSTIASNSARTFVQIDSGCQPYNAKWDATVFATAGACTLFQNNSGLSVTFAGRLSWECAAQVLTLGAGGEVLFSGPLVGNSQNPTAGTFLACEAASLNTDNSTTALGARRSYSQQMASGTNTLTSAFPGQLREVHVEFKASNYHFEYYGIVAPIAGASGGWKESFFIDNANGAGFGTPGFSVNSNGYLIMSNTGWPTTGTNLVTAIYAEKANAVGGAGGKQQKI